MTVELHSAEATVPPAQGARHLHSLAYAQLKGRIISNRYPGGTHILEEQLAADLGISRTPLKEALVNLQAEGLVRMIPRRGVLVVPLTADDIIEIYSVLEVLEDLAVRLIGQREDNRADIKALWQRFRGTTPVATTEAPEAAGRSAHKKFQALIGRHPPARTALSQAEANALAQQLIAPFLPQWVDSPRIELEGDQIRLSARVPANRIPQVKELGQVAGLLPDTPEVSVKGQLVPSAAGGTALAVDQVTAAHIPVPRRLLAAVVRSLKKRGDRNPPDHQRPADAGAGFRHSAGEALRHRNRETGW